MGDVARFAERVTERGASIRERRDALVDWFVELAEQQARVGMRFTAPEASRAELRRVLLARARTFFRKLVSSYEDPTVADLRRVKQRMDGYLRPGGALSRRKERDDAYWSVILAAE